jgi:anti-sigma-K factor RskA
MLRIMRSPDQELIDRLAAEYVLGTLRGPARQRFARWLASDGAAIGAVRRWEDRLAYLAIDVKPVSPAPRVWNEIERRTFRRTAQPRAVSWRPWALAASALLAIGAFLFYDANRLQPEWQVAAQLRDTAQNQDLWQIEFDRQSQDLRVIARTPYPLAASSVHELWALPSSGAAPVSLGLLPQSGQAVLELSDTQVAALRAAGQLAVSREPLGGSPTGQPTGPVLVVSPRQPLA